MKEFTFDEHIEQELQDVKKLMTKITEQETSRESAIHYALVTAKNTLLKVLAKKSSQVKKSKGHG